MKKLPGQSASPWKAASARQNRFWVLADSSKLVYSHIAYIFADLSMVTLITGQDEEHVYYRGSLSADGEQGYELCDLYSYVQSVIDHVVHMKNLHGW